MGDAPQHGTKYSGGDGDCYPEGDPDGMTSQKILPQV